MDEYSALLSIASYVLVFVILYLLICLLKSICRVKRLEDYAIRDKNNNYNLENKLWKFIHKVSKFLSKLSFLQELAENYERFIKSEEKSYKSAMDFVTIKFLSCFFFVALYIFEVFLQGLSFNLLIFILVCCFGFLFPDFLYDCSDYRTYKSIDNDIVSAIILMNNSFKANMSVRQAIDNVIKSTEGPLKEEFIKVKDDINHGFLYEEAFYNMYIRTDLKVVLRISNIMQLINRNGYNLISCFDDLEKDVYKERKELNELKMYDNTNKVFRLIVTFLPLILFSLAILLNKDYLNLIFASKVGYIIVIIEVLIYVIYLCIIEIVRR